jgi:hypothetical protein
MTQSTALTAAFVSNRQWLVGATLAFSLLLNAPLAIAAPAAGDAYVYRVVNGYNNETIGHQRHDITAASTAQGQVVSVTVDTPALGLPRTEMLTADGHWVRHPLDSHGLATDYEFAPALPVAPSPLAAGQSWSVRVNAKVPSANTSRSVRVDGDVLGNERIRVPAGEFDTVKIRRIIYPRDAGDFKTETRIIETDWYAPALGRSVRTETRSNWRAQQSCRRGYCDYHGDWHIVELTEARTATR